MEELYSRSLSNEVLVPYSNLSTEIGTASAILRIPILYLWLWELFKGMKDEETKTKLLATGNLIKAI
jgi:hypothetical protein